MGTQERNKQIFYSDRFDVEDISSLSLFLYSDALSVLARNEHGAVIASHLYSFVDLAALNNIVAEDSLINADNTVGKLHVHNDYFCLVPSVLFDPSQRYTYLKFAAPINEQVHEVFYEGVDSKNVQVVGAVEKTLTAIFDNALPDMEISHAASLVLSYVCSYKTQLLGQEIYVFAEQQNMYVAAFTGNELKLFNRFPVKDEQDFLKYTFAITHQLAFDRMYCRITILGDVKGINVDVDVLREYFKNIQATEPKSNQTYSPGAEIFKETHLLEAYWTL